MDTLGKVRLLLWAASAEGQPTDVRWLGDRSAPPASPEESTRSDEESSRATPPTDRTRLLNLPVSTQDTGTPGIAADSVPMSLCPLVMESDSVGMSSKGTAGDCDCNPSG